MKWNKIKQQVGAEIRTAIIEGRRKEVWSGILIDMIAGGLPAGCTATSASIFPAYADKSYEVVMRWDVRGVGRLRELFPEYFPRSLRTGRLKAYMNDDANSTWEVVKA